MSLIRRKPQKKIRISEAAEMIGCSSESIRTGAVGGFKKFRLNQDKQSPWFVWASDVESYLEKIGR